MGSAQLAKLEGLSEKRAEQSRKTVDHSRQKIAQLDLHRDELKAITREYQKAPDQGVMFTAKLLAHRRAFVTQLTEKLDALNIQRDEQQHILDAQVHELRDRTAQSAAISTVHQSQQLSENVQEARREQQQQDDAFRRVESSFNSDNEDSVDD